MNRRIVHLRHEEVEAQLGELDITILARQGTAMGQMRFASLRAPCSSGIYFLEGDYRLPECVCDSLILTRIGYVAPADNNAYIQVRKPQQAFYLLMRLNHPPASETGVHPSAIIAADVFIPEDCLVGPYCIIETGVQIGHGCRLDSHVIVKTGSVLGDRVCIEPHCTIGATGVAWVWDDNGSEHLIQPQTGGVRIGNDVFIGSDVAIVRGSVNEDTQIGDGTVIAHGSKIGHGCRLGRQCHLANNVSLAGNVDAADRAFFGSGSVVRSMARIAEGVVIGAGAVVIDHIPEPGAVVYGVPARQSDASKEHYAGVPSASKKTGAMP